MFFSPIVVSLNQEPSSLIKLIKSMNRFCISFNDYSFISTFSTCNIINCCSNRSVIKHLDSFIKILCLFKDNSKEKIGRDIIFDKQIVKNIFKCELSISSSVYCYSVLSIFYSCQNQRRPHNSLGSKNIFFSSIEFNCS
jgi:hypothetical protein